MSTRSTPFGTFKQTPHESVCSCAGGLQGLGYEKPTGKPGGSGSGPTPVRIPLPPGFGGLGADLVYVVRKDWSGTGATYEDVFPTLAEAERDYKAARAMQPYVNSNKPAYNGLALIAPDGRILYGWGTLAPSPAPPSGPRRGTLIAIAVGIGLYAASRRG